MATEPITERIIEGPTFIHLVQPRLLFSVSHSHSDRALNVDEFFLVNAWIKTIRLTKFGEKCLSHPDMGQEILKYIKEVGKDLWLYESYRETLRDKLRGITPGLHPQLPWSLNLELIPAEINNTEFHYVTVTHRDWLDPTKEVIQKTGLYDISDDKEYVENPVPQVFSQQVDFPAGTPTVLHPDTGQAYPKIDIIDLANAAKRERRPYYIFIIGCEVKVPTTGYSDLDAARMDDMRRFAANILTRVRKIPMEFPDTRLKGDKLPPTSGSVSGLSGGYLKNKRKRRRTRKMKKSRKVNKRKRRRTRKGSRKH